MNGPETPGEAAGSARPGGPDVGTLAEETERLVAAVAGWAREHAGDVADGVDGTAARLGHSLRDAADHAPGGAECRWCPVCRGASAVRNLSPEVRTHLLVAATSLVQAAAAALDTAVPTQQRAEQPVEHIDLDVEEWEEE